MKRFDLSEIMRNAHRTYKYSGRKQGKTFGEVLKATWRLAKLQENSSIFGELTENINNNSGNRYIY